MKKRIAMLLATVLTGSLIMSGCAKTESTNNNETKKDPNAPVKLTITWWGSQTRHDYTQKLLDMYTAKHPNVTFEAVPAGWDGYFDKLSAQAAGGMLPDIIQMDVQYINTFTKNNTITDLTPFVNDKTLDLSDVDSNVVSTGKVNGKLTGMVVSTTSLALTANPDVFKKAGLELPKEGYTWAQFEKDMITIKEKNGGYGIDKLEDVNYFPYWVRQYGKTMFAQDGTKLGWDDDKVFVEYVSMIQRLQQAKAMPTPDEWTQISAKGKEAQPVVTGGAGATFDWANFNVIAQKANPNLVPLLPPVKDSSTKPLFSKPGMYLSVAESSKNKKAAVEFINWFINDPEANKIINAERGIPVAAKIRESLKASLTQQQKTMFEYAELAVKNSSAPDAPQPAGASEVWKVMTDSVNTVLYNKATAEKAAADFRTKANEILARNAK
jgi:multiple sugar transport system substrate-binding protein